MKGSFVPNFGFVEVEPFQFRESCNHSHVSIGGGGLFERQVGDLWEIRKTGQVTTFPGTSVENNFHNLAIPVKNPSIQCLDFLD